MVQPNPLTPLLEQVVAIAREAGAVILEVYGGRIESRRKADASLITEADDRADALIVERLRALEAALPIVTEEGVARGERPETGERYWLVDPLDGTREFVERNGEFTVNIALIEAGRPVMGVVHAPALGQLYGGAMGFGAFREDAAGRRAIACRDAPPAGITVVSSRSHGDAAAMERFLRGRTVAQQRRLGSSLKFCLIAAGEADLYPRFGRTMEWDTAAGQAVLVAAGGLVTDLQERELRYGKPGLENPGFVARGRPGPGEDPQASR